MSDKIIDTTDAAFAADVIQSELPVLVDFWAPWCGPCKMMAPALDAIAEQFDGKVKVVKINVDDNMEEPQRFQVRGVPTLMLFKDGKVLVSRVGAKTQGQIATLIQETLG